MNTWSSFYLSCLNPIRIKECSVVLSIQSESKSVRLDLVWIRRFCWIVFELFDFVWWELIQFEEELIRRWLCLIQFEEGLIQFEEWLIRSWEWLIDWAHRNNSNHVWERVRIHDLLLEQHVQFASMLNIVVTTSEKESGFMVIVVIVIVTSHNHVWERVRIHGYCSCMKHVWERVRIRDSMFALCLLRQQLLLTAAINDRQ
jgi:hypothetical protein